MSSGIKLIVGLANPGREYENTRHNAGEWFVRELSADIHTDFRAFSKFHGLLAEARRDDQPYFLLIPTTYMNLSGRAVKAVASYYKIPPESILIAHDEVDLPTGTIKLKFDGGDGGHNGLKDIINHLSTKKFYRLRIGVGRPRPGQDTADYVLDKPSKSDRQLIDNAIMQSMDILPLILAGQFQKAMHTLHTSPT